MEEIKIDDRALDTLAEIGSKTSLRYAVQLLTPSKILAQTNGQTNVTEQVVREISTLFLDAKASAKLLQDNKNFLT